MRIVAVLVPHGVVPFDLGIPCDIFEHARLADGSKPYEVRVCGQARRVRSRPFDIVVERTLDGLEETDTIIVLGTDEPWQPIPASIRGALQDAAEKGTRIASICTGAFVLAGAGLLDGRRATTHWRAADILAASYPEVEVHPNVLYVDEGEIVTSAGASAGIDMCLHLVARDFGHSVAANSSRAAVAPFGRAGGQKQFILHDLAAERIAGGHIAEAMSWAEERLDTPITVAQMAAKAGMSSRTFARRFAEDACTTPGQWLIDARTRRARLLLETTDIPVGEVAAQSGFAEASGLRDRFRRVLGVSPKAYRASFGCRQT
ncbi:GlxA family transcriptional regulator [Aurantiacibacter aquimixticola]|uniref:Helix-turn-helix domain-containing protein n=1 Tax=Aurantiacibacter aquimixticola TaxID=1958945 RepID=A0A419RNH6_9SPHN|nr:helix-turn-helix domain-containing protein [Aurantiacibacter aquimixticola]RJY06952.1 helix-turn-helix domain-containing protein [Aurantiacibacter aquimixticola]